MDRTPVMLAARVPSGEGATPAMAQWFAIKADHPDALVFFRMGDFYELFFADAEAAAAALDIALTQRGEHAGQPIPMCGVPVHAAEAYLMRLIRRGYRVAIAEQMENPKSRTGKAPIRREVVRLITPGTITEETLLEAGQPNLLLALAMSGAQLGAAWLDVSTGLFETASLARDELAALLGRLAPAEILAPEDLVLSEWADRRAPEQVPSPPLAARRQLAEAFGVASLAAFGDFSDAEAVAAALALDYVRRTQAGSLPRLSRPTREERAGFLGMDPATRASLEVIRARDGGSTHTLFSVVRRTLTPAGTRMLATWLAAPLTEIRAIACRQDAWSWLCANSAAAAHLRSQLKAAPDMERALARLSLNRGGPRDLAAIRDGIAATSRVAAALEGPLPQALAEARAALLIEPELGRVLTEALADPAPARLEDAGAIRSGFDPELDAERSLRDDSRRRIATLQLDYAQRYGVASLKVRHHQQLGYMIEAPAAAVEKLRGNPELTLRQGMAGGARFSHPELADLDRKISEAAERSLARERAVFTALVERTLALQDLLAGAARALALIDVSQSAAALAEPGTWCRPLVDDSDAFVIRAGRHPVVEAALAGAGRFVPNDCDLSPERRVLLLTGPNMAGKSTFLRQNALAVVLAQAGLPLPATEAHLGVVDRLFSRVGAADDLARGRSTFMVEMTETAAILHQAGPRSLVVVDEIGRGTSTLDGLAIAWAVLEQLHSAVRARTIFATHFHELAGLGDRLPGLAPHTMRVREWKGSVVFLHEVAPGVAGRSWGVHVAELAGVPAATVRRAASLLAALERRSSRVQQGAETPLAALPLFAAVSEAEIQAAVDDQRWPAALPRAVMERLETIDPDQMSPRDALETLYGIKAMLSGGGRRE
jgi:DNA mismatch repair protein MutS